MVQAAIIQQQLLALRDLCCGSQDQGALAQRLKILPFQFAVDLTQMAIVVQEATRVCDDLVEHVWHIAVRSRTLQVQADHAGQKHLARVWVQLP